MERTSGTIRIGKEKFAAGLFWQPAPTPMMAAREARIVAAKAELAADLFCVRKRGVPQFGLGQRKGGHRAGMRAIAPSLASNIPESNWVGVFPAGQVWLYVMVRKGAIMPDGDVLFTSEREARERLRGEMSIGEWDVVFAPSHWQLDESRSDDLIDLISRQSDARLKSVVRRSSTFLIFFCSFVGAVAVMWVTFFPPASDVPSVPNVPATPPPPPKPWQGAPPVGGIILACEREIEAAGSLPGFDIDMVTCGPVGSVAIYRRRGGSIAWLPRNATVLSPDRVTITTPLSIQLIPRTIEEQPTTIDSLRRMIWGAAQTYRLESELTDPAAPGSSLFPGRVAPDAALPSYRALLFSLGGRLPPNVLLGLLSSIPAFVVDEVSWQSTGWRVKGKAYVR